MNNPTETAPRRAKLTRQLLADLQEGSWVMSNILGSDMKPSFLERVADTRVRSEQWHRAVAAGANNRLAMVFHSQAAALTFLASMNPVARQR